MKRWTWILLLIIASPYLRAQENGDSYFQWGRQMEIISSVIEQMMNNYVEDPNAEKMGTDAIRGMLSHTDRYTRFYDEQQMFEQRLRRSGKVSGIGVRLRNRDEGLEVREVLIGTPAREAGLLPGDLILAVDGRSLQDLSYRQRDRLITGKPDTQVSLKVRRGKKTFELNITRRIIEQKAIPYYGMIDSQTGYIHLRKFTSTASGEVREALVELKNRGAKRLILDLRGNPGGLLDQAVATVNLFIPKDKKVVETRGRFQKFHKVYTTKRPPLDEKIPLFVWVNDRSASASEIVSGTLQDYDRAVIVGDTTFGKGLVQRFFPLQYGTYIKITIAKYYLPSGRLIQKKDYWHRDSQGRVTRYRGNKVFHTARGRKVYEHGGVAPDIYVESDTLLPVILAAQKKDLFFDFVTAYLRNHSSPASVGELSESRLAGDFVRYARSKIDSLTTPWISSLETALGKARKQDADPGSIRDMEQLLRRMRNRQWELLNAKDGRRQAGIIIKRMLILHYFGSGELSKYDLNNSHILDIIERH